MKTHIYANLAWLTFVLLLNSMSHDAMLYSSVAILLAWQWLKALSLTIH